MESDYFIAVDYFTGIIFCSTIAESITISKSLDRHLKPHRIITHLKTGIYVLVGPTIKGIVHFIRLYPNSTIDKSMKGYEERRWERAFTKTKVL